jgi:exosortase
MSATTGWTSPYDESPSFGWKHWVIAGAIAVGVLPLYAAELVVMANMSMYQFYPFVFAFIGWQTWKRYREAEPGPGPRSGAAYWAESLLLCMSLLCLVFHAGLFGPWLGGAAGTLALGAAVLSARRVIDIKLWDLWALLLVTMRLPLELNGQLAAFLQRCSSFLSGHVLDFIGLMHERAGNVIRLPERELFVDEACSGIVSVMAVVAVSAMLAIVRQRRIVHTLLLVLSGIFWAMLMNVLRICAIAIASSWYGLDWTGGAVHEAISLVGFMAAFLAVLSTDLLLIGVLAPIEEPIGDRLIGGQRILAWYNRLVDWEALNPEPRTRSSPPRRMPSIGLSVLSLLFVMAGVFHSVALYANYRDATADHGQVVAMVKSIPSDEVAAALGPWMIDGEEFIERKTISELAPYSRSFTVRHPDLALTAVLSIDFPFYRKWHDVCGCYTNAGWTQLSKDVKNSDDATCTFVRADMQDIDGSFGRLLFANLAETGELIVPPSEMANLGFLVRTFVGKLQHSRQLSLNPHRVFQVQVFANSGRELTSEERTELEQLFLSAYGFVQNHLEKTSPDDLNS